MRYILAAVLFFSISSCSAPRSIEEPELELIIREVLLTEAIKSKDEGLRAILQREDSVDVYLSILTRRGYTMTDFQHTIKEMSTRKSNPLSLILDRVVSQIDAMAEVAQSRYLVARRFDSLALAAYTDTIYKRDTTIRGSVSKFKIVIDTTVIAGDYSVRFAYRSVDDYRAGSKSIRYSVGDTSRVEKEKQSGTLWINRQTKESFFNSSFTLFLPHDTLRLVFVEPKLDALFAKTLKDSSYIKDLRIVYFPPLIKARQMYYRQYFGITPSFFKDYETKKDSLPLRIGPWL